NLEGHRTDFAVADVQCPSDLVIVMTLRVGRRSVRDGLADLRRTGKPKATAPRAETFAKRVPANKLSPELRTAGEQIPVLADRQTRPGYVQLLLEASHVPWVREHGVGVRAHVLGVRTATVRSLERPEKPNTDVRLATARIAPEWENVFSAVRAP